MSNEILPLNHHRMVIRNLSKVTISRILAYRIDDEAEHARVIALRFHAPRRGSSDPSWVNRYPGGRKAIQDDVERVLDENPGVEVVQVQYDAPGATVVYGRHRRLRFDV